MTEIEIIGYLISSVLIGFFIGYFYWKYVFTKESAVVRINANNITGNGDEPLLEMNGRGTLIVKSNDLRSNSSEYIEKCIREHENSIRGGTIIKPE